MRLGFFLWEWKAHAWMERGGVGVGAICLYARCRSVKPRRYSWERIGLMMHLMVATEMSLHLP
jgi:hypothetical protein